MFLPLNLQFFSEEGTNQENTQDSQDLGSNTHENTGSDDSQKNEHMIPKSRFDEVNNKFKELQSQLDEITKQKETDQLESKKKQGKFEELYNETQSDLEKYKTTATAASGRIEQLEGIIQVLVEQELEAVPEDMRDLVPENFTTEQKLSWITNAKKKGLFGAATSSKAEEELGGSTNPQEQKADIRQMSIADLFKSAYGKK